MISFMNGPNPRVGVAVVMDGGGYHYFLSNWYLLSAIFLLLLCIYVKCIQSHSLGLDCTVNRNDDNVMHSQEI